MAKVPRSYFLYAGLLPLGVIVLDQLSKYWALGLFKQPHDFCAAPVSVPSIELSPIIDFSLFCNRGVSLSMFSSDSQVVRWALTIFALAMVIGMLIWLWQAKGRVQKLALGLIIGGALGNVIDRILYGAVIDFIDASDIYFNYVFNVADSAISCGVVGLLISAFFFEGKEEKSVPKS